MSQRDASFLIERNRRRALFAARVQRETAFLNGTQKNIQLEGPRPHTISFNPHYYLYKEGAYFTTPEEYAAYVASVSGGSTATVPSAPTLTSYTADETSITLSFTAGSNGGAAITNYQYSLDGGTSFTAFSPAQTTSPVIISDLSSGTSYNIKLKAVNSVGAGAASNTLTCETNSPAPSGPSGAAEWATFMNDDSTAATKSVTVDSAHKVIVAGVYSASTMTLNRPDTDGITQIATQSVTYNGANNNIYVAKYTAAGSPEWCATIGGDIKGGNVYGVITDATNNVYAAVGFYQNTGLDITFYNADGTAYATTTSNTGFAASLPSTEYIIKYNSSGQIQWVSVVYTQNDGNPSNYAYIAAACKPVIDSTGSVYFAIATARAGGGAGATLVKFQTNTVVSGVLTPTEYTRDSYPYASERQRSYLVKLDSSGNFTWIARNSSPVAHGEFGTSTFGNVVVDISDNVYISVSGSGGSSPISRLYSGATNSAGSLSVPASYYIIDPRSPGNSISPLLPQYYRYSAIAKFSSAGVFQAASFAHSLFDGSTQIYLDMYPFLVLDKATNSIYMAMRTHGFIGNATDGTTPLNKVYINSFDSFIVNGSNFDIFNTNTFTLFIAQPSTQISIVKYNTSLVAQIGTFVNTPGAESGFTKATLNPNLTLDKDGNLVVGLTIKDNTTSKTVYSYSSINFEGTVQLNTFGTIEAQDASNYDGVFVSFTPNLVARWAVPIYSTSGLTEQSPIPFADPTQALIYFCGESAVASGGTLEIKDYDTVTGGAIQTTSFGSMNLAATANKTVGYLLKYYA
jgi:hypothetical protein